MVGVAAAYGTLRMGSIRLTPFANDPVADPTAEAIFLRDDDTGALRSPTPAPAPPKRRSRP